MTEEQEAEPAEQADDVAEDVDEDADGLQNGDFVELEYTAYTSDGDQLVDTTDQTSPRKKASTIRPGVQAPNNRSRRGPHLRRRRRSHHRLRSRRRGTVTVAAEDAFGEYDADNVQTVSAEKIDEDDRYPGANIQIDGEQGYISTIIGGRARVDFNHPLAGEDVEYEYEILGEVDDREQKAAGLFEMFLGMEPDLWIETDEVEEEVPVEPDEDDDEDAEPEFETELVEKETLYLEATPQMTMNQQWMMGKQQIAQQIMEKVDVDRVIVQEVIDGMGGMGMGGMMGGMGGMGGEDIEEASRTPTSMLTRSSKNSKAQTSKTLDSLETDHNRTHNDDFRSVYRTISYTLESAASEKKQAVLDVSLHVINLNEREASSQAISRLVSIWTSSVNSSLIDSVGWPPLRNFGIVRRFSSSVPVTVVSRAKTASAAWWVRARFSG